MGTLLGIIIVLAGIVGVIALLTCFRAFVLMKLWAWFIVPLFGLPALNIPYAIGLALVMGMFFTTSKKEEDKNFWATAIANPLIILFIGWIVQMFL